VIDAAGRITEARVAGLFNVINSYDAKGRLTATQQGDTVADQRTVNFAYNPQGYLQSATDPLGRSVSYEYDAVGRTTRQVMPDGQEILYSYDANGNLISLTPPGRPGHVFKYTKIDQTEEYQPPDPGVGQGGSTLYEYDLDKALTKILRPDGLSINFTYDAAGRLSKQTTPEGDTVYGYHATTGKLVSLDTPDGLGLDYIYNGALLTQTAWSGAIVGTVGFSYDNDFRVTGVSVNGANTIAYNYDADSLLTQAGALTLNRSAQNGLLTGTSLSNLSDAFSYNGFGEVTAYSAKASGAEYFRTEFSFDKLGRIVQKVETLSGAANTYDYAYDLAGRLAQVKKNNAVQFSYGYDANGNRTHVNGNQVAHYDDQDRLTDYDGANYAYTANGELQSKTVGAATTSYQYDVLGNLRHVALPGGTQLDYLIDGQNRRIGKKRNGTLEWGLLYQDGLKPIAELDANGNVVSRFVYATHANVPDYMIKGGVTYRFITDHLGSPRLVIKDDGTVLQRLDYDEWGNVTHDSNPGFQPFGFAGGLYDRDTKLVRFGARDYDARTGRWTAKDPIGFEGGDPSLFNYVLNSPVNSVDPSGLSCLGNGGGNEFGSECLGGAPRSGGSFSSGGAPAGNFARSVPISNSRINSLDIYSDLSTPTTPRTGGTPGGLRIPTNSVNNANVNTTPSNRQAGGFCPASPSSTIRFTNFGPSRLNP
jgi:RHS repeat-associated protein